MKPWPCGRRWDRARCQPGAMPALRKVLREHPPAQCRLRTTPQPPYSQPHAVLGHRLYHSPELASPPQSPQLPGRKVIRGGSPPPPTPTPGDPKHSVPTAVPDVPTEVAPSSPASTSSPAKSPSPASKPKPQPRQPHQYSLHSPCTQAERFNRYGGRKAVGTVPDS